MQLQAYFYLLGVKSQMNRSHARQTERQSEKQMVTIQDKYHFRSQPNHHVGLYSICLIVEKNTD